jgi:hypothetical protein
MRVSGEKKVLLFENVYLIVNLQNFSLKQEIRLLIITDNPFRLL